jgi:hypothetical protein
VQVRRPGHAGSNTTADHLDVLKAAIGQVPAGHRRKLLVRADGAGASHGLLDWLTGLNTASVHGRRGRSVEYSVGFAITEQVRQARIQGHWRIENALRWVRDVVFDEDRHQLRVGAGPHAMATLRNTAISLLRLARMDQHHRRNATSRPRQPQTDRPPGPVMNDFAEALRVRPPFHGRL